MIGTPLRALCIVSALLLASAPPALAQREIRTERVEFAPGAIAAVREAAIAGYDVIDYVLRARAGQYANISMATDNLASYFNILAPGETGFAMFNGSLNENQYEGILPASGDYRVRIYMMRSAARRNEVARYRLEMIITDVPDRPSAERDALVPGTPYHATGTIPCAMRSGEPAASCPFGVLREGGGSGTVVVTKPDGRARAIFFRNGTADGPMSAKPTPAGSA